MPPFSMTPVNCSLHFVAEFLDITFYGDLKCLYEDISLRGWDILHKLFVPLKRLDGFTLETELS